MAGVFRLHPEVPAINKSLTESAVGLAVSRDGVGVPLYIGLAIA